MVDYSTLKDYQLLEHLQGRNHAAYTEIYRRYWHVLFLHSYKILQDEHAAQDVIQDLFTQLWNKEELGIETSLKAYLYRMSRNLTLNAINREKQKDRYLDSLALYMNQDHCITEDEVRYRELASQIEQGVQMLPPKMKTIFTMSRNEGISHNDIAFELGVSVNTVKSTINRALKVLRSKVTTFLFL